MRLIKCLFLVLPCLFLFSTVSAVQDVPTLTRIGRGAVQSAQWSPDGSFVLVSTITGAWLYAPDLQDLAHIPDAQHATLSPDGRYIAGTADEKNITLWDTVTFQPVQTIETPMRRIGSLYWHPDSLQIDVTGNQDRDTFLTYALDSESSPFGGWMPAAPSPIVRSPDEKYDATYDQNLQEVIVTGVDLFLRLKPYPATDPTPHLVWGDSAHLYWRSDGEISGMSAWEIPSGNVMFDGESCPGVNAVFSPDMRWLYVDCYRIIRKVDALSFEVQQDFEAGDFIRSLALSEDGSMIANGEWYADEAKTARIFVYATETGALLRVIDMPRGYAGDLHWRPGTHQLLAVTDRSELIVFDPTTGQQLATQDAHTTGSEVIAWDSDSTHLAAGDTLGNVHIWDAAGEHLNTFAGGFRLTQIAWQPQGDLIATRSGGYSQDTEPIIRLWDSQRPSDRALLHTLEMPDREQPVGMDWSPDGQQLAGVTLKHMLFLWTLPDAQQPREIPFWETEELTGNVRWSPDGQQLAVPNGSGMYIYNLAASELTFGGYISNEVWTWTDDNQLLGINWSFSGDGGYTPAQTEPYLRIIGSGEYANRLIGLTRPSSTAFLSPKGHFAAAIDNTGGGMVWDTATRAPLFMLAGAVQVVWSPDESHLGMQRLDGTVWVLTVEGVIEDMLPAPLGAAKPSGVFFWSPDSRKLAHLHDGVIDVWVWQAAA